MKPSKDTALAARGIRSNKKRTDTNKETEDRGPATESPSRLPRGIRSYPIRFAYGVPLRSRKKRTETNKGRDQA
jgi:hypothetical protein